jgi:hypothetical protein
MKKAILFLVLTVGFLSPPALLNSGFAMDHMDDVEPARDRMNSLLHAQLQDFRRDTDAYLARLHSTLNLSGLSNEEQYNLRVAQQAFTTGLANIFDRTMTVLEEQRRQAERQERQIQSLILQLRLAGPRPHPFSTVRRVTTAPAIPPEPQLGTPIRLGEAAAAPDPPPPSLPVATVSAGRELGTHPYPTSTARSSDTSGVVSLVGFSLDRGLLRAL